MATKRARVMLGYVLTVATEIEMPEDMTDEELKDAIHDFPIAVEISEAEEEVCHRDIAVVSQLELVDVSQRRLVHIVINDRTVVAL